MYKYYVKVGNKFILICCNFIYFYYFCIGGVICYLVYIILQLYIGVLLLCCFQLFLNNCKYYYVNLNIVVLFIVKGIFQSELKEIGLIQK